MKRFLTLSISALLIVAMSAPSLEAQSRSGNGGRGGSGSRPSSGSTSSRSGQQMQSRPQQRQPSARPQQPTQQRQPSVRPQQPTQQRQPAARPQQPAQQRQPSARPQQPTQQRQPAARPQQPSNNRNGNVQVRRGGSNVPRSAAPAPDYSRAQRREPSHGRVQYRPVRHSRPAPHPARREPIHHSHSHSFWHSGPHYYGYRVTVIPSYHVRHVYWGVPYYIADNIYYRLRNGHYYVCRPPYGVIFNPVEAVAYAACRFAFYTSVLNTYSTVNQNAELITQQNATIAANNAIIAQQNETIALNNRLASNSYSLANGLGLVQSYGDASMEYFYDDGVFFTKKADGSYVTMVPPAGALVQELPEDYETKVLSDGNEYYVVDNTVFRLSVIDGSPYFEVIGQLTGSV